MGLAGIHLDVIAWRRQIDYLLYFTNRDAWRAWLEEHHATAKEAWLLHYKKHTGKPGLSLEEAVEEALCFG